MKMISVALALALAPVGACAQTLVTFGDASVSFPRGVPKKIETSPAEVAKARDAYIAAHPDEDPSRIEKMVAAVAAGESWEAYDADTKQGFRAMTAPAFDPSLQNPPPCLDVHTLEDSPSPFAEFFRGLPECREVIAGTARGLELRRRQADGATTIRLSVDKNGKTYLLSYFHANPGEDDADRFFASFRLDGEVVRILPSH